MSDTIPKLILYSVVFVLGDVYGIQYVLALLDMIVTELSKIL